MVGIGNGSPRYKRAAFGHHVMTTKSTLSRDDVLGIARDHKEVLKEQFGVSEVYLLGSIPL